MIKMRPEEYVENALKSTNLGEIRKISENLMKKLEERRVCKNKMDFVCDDLPNMQNIMDSRNSGLSPHKLKDMEKEYGPNGRNFVEAYSKQQRQAYGFWSKVLKIVKVRENG